MNNELNELNSCITDIKGYINNSCLNINCDDIVMRIHEPIDTDKDGNALVLMDVMATEDLIVEELETKIKLEKMYRYIEEVLSEREKIIVKLRYGTGGKVPLTQREVASRLNISRSYVSRIEKKALKTLKKRFEKV